MNNASPLSHPSEPHGAEKFAGNAFLSYNTLLLAGIIIFVGLRLWLELATGGVSAVHWVLYPGLLVGFYVYTAYRMFYYKVSDRCLIVKNHFMPWWTRTYDLKDIKNIVVHRYYRSSKSLGITLRSRNFSRDFAAGSLRSRHWIALKARLIREGLPVSEEGGVQY